jgi:hypothetical protein
MPLLQVSQTLSDLQEKAKALAARGVKEDFVVESLFD